MLKEVETLYTIRETETDGHAPVLFHCSDGNNYFCKYKIWPKPDEINCLAFEVIASVLLCELKIPTPDIALVKIKTGTLDKTKIKSNKRMKEELTVFGSKEIMPTRLVSDLDEIHNKSDFKKLLNTEDLIRIALFDLWIKNRDRGRNLRSGHNFNLLFQTKKKEREIVAFDHAFIFGFSQHRVYDFTPNTAPIGGGYLFQTPFYLSVKTRINPKEFHKVIDDFVPLLSQDFSSLISDTFQKLPESWITVPNLGDKIIGLLSHQTRIQQLAQILKNARP